MGETGPSATSQDFETYTLKVQVEKAL
jgi:hypothetical protein